MKKLFLALSALVLSAITLSAQAPTTPPPSNTPANNGGGSNQGTYGNDRAAERQAWKNLTPEQRSQVHQLFQKQIAERKACRTGSTPCSLTDLRQKQFTERQGLAQSLGLKHLPGPRRVRYMRRNNRRHPRATS